MSRKRDRYCGMCDEWFKQADVECPKCGADTELSESERAYLERSYADAVDSGTAGCSESLVLRRDR